MAEQPPSPSRRHVLQGLAGAAASLSLGDVNALLAAGPAGRPPEPPAPPLARLPRPEDEVVQDSTVGNLLAPIERIRDAYGYATESFALDKYAAADYPAWQKRMRERIFAMMAYAPPKAPFDAETVETVDRGAFTREKVYFNTTPEFRVPAYVLVPKNLKAKAPAIVALHDHGAFYRWGKEKLVHVDGEHPILTKYKDGYANRSIADDLATQGYVVIVIDLFYWGERRLRLPADAKPGAETEADVRALNRHRREFEEVLARTLLTAGFAWPGLTFWDDIRMVDYLASRPEVDAGRIGCVGLSLGAWRTCHLAAFDDRIKAAVAVCWLTSFRDLQRKNVVHTTGLTKLLPGLYRSLDMPDVVSLAAPRALLCINGLKDGLFPVETGVRPAYKTLETVYAKVGAADRFKGHLYDAPHEFNAAMQEEAWAWLRKWL